MSFDIQSQMQNNLAQFCLQLKDNQVFFKDVKGLQYQGVVSNITPTDKTIIFKEFQDYLTHIKQNNKKIKFSDLSFVRLLSNTKQIFKTDCETSKQKRDRETKTLIKWSEHDDQELLQLDHGQQSIHFDQFEANQEKFGVTATYDEDSYTTHLKVQQIDEHLKSYADSQVNAVIQNSSLEKNRHLLEERNLKPLQDKFEEDEEAKYSAVMGAGNYKQSKQKKKKNKQKSTEEEEKSLRAPPPPGLGKFFNSKVQEPVIELPQPPKKTIRTKSDGQKQLTNTPSKKQTNSPQGKVSKITESKKSEELQNKNIPDPVQVQEVSKQIKSNEIKQETKNEKIQLEKSYTQAQEKSEFIQTLANIAPPPSINDEAQPKKQENKKPLRLTAAPLTKDALQQSFQKQKVSQQKEFNLDQLAPQNIAKESQNQESVQNQEKKQLKLQSKPFKFQQTTTVQYPQQPQYIPPQQGFYDYDQTYLPLQQQPYFYPQQYPPQQWYYPMQYQQPPTEYRQQK